MIQKLSTYTSQKKETKASSVLIISALILAIVILCVAGYFLFRDYQKRYTKSDLNTQLVDDSSILQPQFAQKEAKPVTFDATYSLNPQKTAFVNDLIQKLGTNPNIASQFIVSFKFQAKVNQISRQSQNNYLLSLKDEYNKTLDLILTNEEMNNAQVYSQSTGTIETLSFLDLKPNYMISVEGSTNLLNDNYSIYRIEILSGR